MQKSTYWAQEGCKSRLIEHLWESKYPKGMAQEGLEIDVLNAKCPSNPSKNRYQPKRTESERKANGNERISGKMGSPGGDSRGGNRQRSFGLTA